MEYEFISLRNKYIPSELKVVFVLESPPEGHGYFYNPKGKVSEVLFKAFMKLLNFCPITKEEGLKKLMDNGWLLVNPIYKPVNKLPDKEANKLILDNYSNFKKDLISLGVNKDTSIILVKSNICKLLELPLKDDGFNVINNSLVIPFPLHYHLNNFNDKILSLLKKA